MTRDAIDAILYIMDAAFVGDPYQQQSVLNNLKSVRDDDWFWLPDGAKRSIYDIVEHIGGNKYIYDNNAFGDGSMKWDNPGPCRASIATPRRTRSSNGCAKGTAASAPASTP